MIKKLITFIKKEAQSLIILTLPFLLANLAKVLYFHAELVYYNQDLSNFIYVLLFNGAWLCFIFFLVLQRKRSLLLIFWGLQLFYMVLNLNYFIYYGTYLSIRQALSLLSEFLSLLANKSTPFHPRLLILFVDLPFFLHLMFKGRYPQHGRRFSRGLVVLSLLLLVMLYGYRVPELGSNLLRSKKERFVGSFGLLTLQISDFIVAHNYEEELDPSRFPEWRGEKTGNSEKNVVFIQVETLDANVLGARHKGKPIMPFLEDLASRGIYHPYALAYHEGGGTSDADFSVLNSTEPLDDYAVINLPGFDYPNSMVKQLAQAGYNTMAFHGNVAEYWNRETAFPLMGFDDFFDIRQMGLSEYGWGAQDRDLFSFVNRELREIIPPYFAFIITMSSHGPFKNISLYYENDRFDDLPEKHPDRDYYKAMAYVDECLEEFFFEAGFDFEETLVIIYGDHTEYYPMNPEARRAFYSDRSLKLEFVPLIILGGAEVVPETRRWAASFLDIAPTVLTAAGIDFFIHSPGADLLSQDTAEKAPPIPFNGVFFDRIELYNMAEGTK